MGKLVARVASYFAFTLFMLVGKAASRHMHYDAPELVSDGLGDVIVQHEESVLLLKGMDASEDRAVSANVWIFAMFK